MITFIGIHVLVLSIFGVISFNAVRKNSSSLKVGLIVGYLCYLTLLVIAYFNSKFMVDLFYNRDFKNSRDIGLSQKKIEEYNNLPQYKIEDVDTLFKTMLGFYYPTKIQHNENALLSVLAVQAPVIGSDDSVIHLCNRFIHIYSRKNLDVTMSLMDHDFFEINQVGHTLQPLSDKYVREWRFTIRPLKFHEGYLYPSIASTSDNTIFQEHVNGVLELYVNATFLQKCSCLIRQHVDFLNSALLISIFTGLATALGLNQVIEKKDRNTQNKGPVTAP